MNKTVKDLLVEVFEPFGIRYSVESFAVETFHIEEVFETEFMINKRNLFIFINHKDYNSYFTMYNQKLRDALQDMGFAIIKSTYSDKELVQVIEVIYEECINKGGTS